MMRGVGVLGNQGHRIQVGAQGDPEPQASKRTPRSSGFDAGEEGGGLNSHLGPGWARELAGEGGVLVPISQGRCQR